MPGIAQIGAVPGIGSTVDALSKRILWTRDHLVLLPGGVVINGAKSRDLTNTGYTTVLQAGTLLGRITSTGKYAPSIIGKTAVLHDTSGVTTTMTLPAAVVAEISRRIGASGTFRIVGPPSEAGVVASEVVTYSAIASTTTITITATSADFAAGSLICANDGSYIPLCIIAKEDGVQVADRFGTDYDVALDEAAIGGFFLHDQIVNWSSDASVNAWIKEQLRASGYAYVFNDDFGF